MKVGVITPTSGNRPNFLERNKFYIDRQTVKPDHHVIITGTHSLTQNYRDGIKQLKDKVDLIFFMEDDDYYRENYIEKMLEVYDWAGSPDIFGIGETYFYHPDFNAVWYRHHPDSSPCAFQMVLKSSAVNKIDWSLINTTFIDAGLWRQLKGETVIFENPISIGIKHGRGSCLAGGHTKWFYDDRIRMNNKDEWAKFDSGWLREKIGDDAGWYEDFSKDRGVL